MHVPSISPSYSSSSSSSFGSSGMEVRTAAEARRKATQQLENLQTIVQTASDILGALSKAAANRLQNQNQNQQHQQHLKPAKQQHIPVPANSSSSVPLSAVAATAAVQPNYNHRLSSEPANPKNNNASPASKPAVLFAMFLGGSGFG
ncbi:hypothetical protein GGI11_007892, partial [Coemansia sp. RSA 2049]